MKLLPVPVALLILGTSALGADVQRILTEAQTAMLRGDLETAKRNFQIVYQLDPKNAVAIGGLRQIALEERKGGGSGSVEKQFAQLILPQVQFKEATFTEALDFLKKKVTDVSGGKQTANFVVQPGIDPSSKVTLSLTNIPFTEALRYLGELVSAKIDYQKYAIVIRPANGAARP
jgi:hypothetical protein